MIKAIHWNQVYSTKSDKSVSWYEDLPFLSVQLIDATGLLHSTPIVDIGGGTSRLVDNLLAAGYKDITVLDISDKALEVSKARLGEHAHQVKWITTDILKWESVRQYGIWHDRAAFHFLITPEEQQRYVERVKAAVNTGGYVIIGTFAPDGPEMCSGLPVARHSESTIAKLLGGGFRLIYTKRHDHRTPSGSIQKFQFSMFQVI